jgi:adenine-specific DNA-methyltransferase
VRHNSVQQVRHKRKKLGQFFTPPAVAKTLVAWLSPKPIDRILDPSCGDGEFLALHKRSVGIELDASKAALARQRCPGALIHSGDFFTWSSKTTERFEAAVGNPPFIRYQHFTGAVREKALEVAARLGAKFNGLSSSWAPFLVATASLLKPHGAMAFVVPAEIGHATYATPLLECLCGNFGFVGIVAVREKLFPDLSEDVWLLFCTGFGGMTGHIGFEAVERFTQIGGAPEFHQTVPTAEWRQVGHRLRPFLLPRRIRARYEELSNHHGVHQLSELAHAGIGYVTGANDFFHVRPSVAKRWGIPGCCLRVAVRRTEQLPDKDVNSSVVRRWLRDDNPVLLLDLSRERELPDAVCCYLDSEDGHRARETFKCSNRNPWYVVPDVHAPDAFLTYMSGVRPAIVANSARCVCTNSVHAVRLKGDVSVNQIQRAWSHPLAQLSCELEGHPLGGGMLKLEPGEANRTVLPTGEVALSESERADLLEGIGLMRRWRHYA